MTSRNDHEDREVLLGIMPGLRHAMVATRSRRNMTDGLSWCQDLGREGSVTILCHLTVRMASANAGSVFEGLEAALKGWFN